MCNIFASNFKLGQNSDTFLNYINIMPCMWTAKCHIITGLLSEEF